MQLLQGVVGGQLLAGGVEAEGSRGLVVERDTHTHTHTHTHTRYALYMHVPLVKERPALLLLSPGPLPFMRVCLQVDNGKAQMRVQTTVCEI
jgi:hypothetical protein